MNYSYTIFERCLYCNQEEYITVEEKFEDYYGNKINPYEYEHEDDEEYIYNFHTHDVKYCNSCSEVTIEEI